MTVPAAVPEPIDYAERWRQIVESRREYMDGLYARVGRTTANYWASRSDFFRPSVRRQAGPDPFLTRVLDQLTPGMTVLDVGAGGGRYAIPLAAHAREVVAVEPAEPMVRVLHEEAEQAGVTNLRIVQADWLAAAVEPADVVICSHVVYPITDIVPFFRKLDEKTKKVCLLYLNAGQPPWEDPNLWRRFHDEPMRPQPTYIDAYNVLYQMGIRANVEIVAFERTGILASPTFEVAVGRVRDSLILDDSPETTSRLEAVVREVMVHDEAGWRLPTRPAQAAIVWWGPKIGWRGAAPEGSE